MANSWTALVTCTALCNHFWTYPESLLWCEDTTPTSPAGEGSRWYLLPCGSTQSDDLVCPAQSGVVVAAQQQKSLQTMSDM